MKIMNCCFQEKNKYFKGFTPKEFKKMINNLQYYIVKTGKWIEFSELKNAMVFPYFIKRNKILMKEAQNKEGKFNDYIKK